MIAATRLIDGPIIGPELDASIGVNIQGPSLIKVPDWVEDPLGKYYLYFADHKGSYIRLAYADQLTGPWQIHVPGSLQLADSCFPSQTLSGTTEQIATARKYVANNKMAHDAVYEMQTPHIASPDVHVDLKNHRIVMYFHGLESFGLQRSRVAMSQDGIRFVARPEIIGRTYMRVFHHRKHYYSLAMPGVFYRSLNGLSGFEKGPTLFEPDMRHCAVLKRGNKLHVFWTQARDIPERILLTTIDISDDWHHWTSEGEVDVLKPERDWEGADAPLEPSIRSVAYGHVNQLRDPAIFEENDRVYLLYAVAGESGDRDRRTNRCVSERCSGS